MKKVIAIYSCDNGYDRGCSEHTSWEETDEDWWNFDNNDTDEPVVSKNNIILHYQKAECNSGSHRKKLINLYIIDEDLL